LNDIVEIVDKEFEREIHESVKDLFLAYDEDSERELRKYIMSLYQYGIPNAGNIIDMMENTNFDKFHEITYTLLKYKKGDVFCELVCEKDERSGVIGIDVCDGCIDREDCYDNVFINNVQWDFGDQTFPLHLCNLLSSVLTDGDLCVYMDRQTVLEYPDLSAYYDYANVDILEQVYHQDNDKLIIINHAQGLMFEDLVSVDDGSCYNYGNFVLMYDHFKAKHKGEYLIKGE